MKARLNHPTTLCCLAALGLLASAGNAMGQCSSQKLLSSDGVGLDLFGTSVSMTLSSGNPAAAIGARWDDTAGGVAAGSVYTFQRIGSSWGQLSHIFASDGAQSDYFGTSVGYADPYIIVGAPGTGTGGAAYVFERSGSTWTQKSKIQIGGPVASDGAGTSVAIEATSGGWALVGVPGRDIDVSPNSGISDPGAGVVLLCQRQANGTWSAVDTWPDRYQIYSGTYENEAFGSSVSIAGNVAVCGVPFGESINWPTDHGFIRVYRRDPATNTWAADGWLVSNNAQQDDHYGAAVSTDGTSIAIGAPDDDATAAQIPDIGSAKQDSGCVYIQRYVSGAWTIDGQVFASDATNSARFGSSVAISGDKLVIGAAGAKKTYVFKRVSAGHWTQIAQYNDPDTTANGSFGNSVALVGDQMIIADSRDDGASATDQGAAYAFTMPGETTGADLCAAATAIQSGVYSGCTLNAGADSTTTCGGGGTGYGPDVWFSWTPTCSGNVIIDTFGSSFDTVLSIHSSCPGGGGSNTLTCNDDGFSLPSRDSLVTFDYIAGTQYLIRVAGYNGAKGDFNLRVNEYQHPANDACANSQRIYNGPNFFKNCKATIDGPLDDTGCVNDNNQGADVWFKYTATSTGPLTVNTCGANFDTVLTVYTVSCPTFNSQAIACSDDTALCGGVQSLQSSTTFNATSGTTYTIRVGGYEPPTNTDTRVGQGNLNVLPACPCDFNGNGLSVQDIFDFINAWLAGNPSADFNGGGLEVQDIFDYLNCWFGGCA